VLEIGFGPDIAVREIARHATRGEVVRYRSFCGDAPQEARRNAAVIRSGRVSRTVASVEDLPDFGRPFDKGRRATAPLA